MAKKKQISLQGVDAVIYARYSSHNQNDASIEQQVAKCEEHAAKLGARIVHVYADRAMSGRTDKRPDFQRMMYDATKGTFKAVIAWKSNRMGRNMMEALINNARLDELGVVCSYVEENFGETAAGRFALRNMMNVNEFYSEAMAEDIARGLHDAASKARVIGSIPLGYKKGEDGKYVIDEPAAAVVREIFNRIALHESLASIADDLNARHIRTSRNKTWGKSSFHAITRNEKYIGHYNYSDDVRLENAVPPIVDEDVFYKVQGIVGRRAEVAGRRNENEDYLLTGKLYCGKCGSPMTGISGTGRSGTMHFYYICRKRRIEHACDKGNVRKEYIERIVAEALKDYVLRDDVIDWIADNVMQFRQKIIDETRIEYYANRLKEVRASINNIVRAIETGSFSPAISSRLQELENEERELQSTIAQEKTKIPNITREHVRFFLKRFQSGRVEDVKFRRALFDNFLEAVYLYDDKMKIVFNYAKGKNSLTVPTKKDIDDSTEDGSFNDPTVPRLDAETNRAGLFACEGLYVLTVLII